MRWKARNGCKSMRHQVVLVPSTVLPKEYGNNVQRSVPAAHPPVKCHTSGIYIVREHMSCFVSQLLCPFQQPKLWRSEDTEDPTGTTFKSAGCTSNSKQQGETPQRYELIMVFLRPDGLVSLQHGESREDIGATISPCATAKVHGSNAPSRVDDSR